MSHVTVREKKIAEYVLDVSKHLLRDLCMFHVEEFSLGAATPASERQVVSALSRFSLSGGKRSVDPLF